MSNCCGFVKMEDVAFGKPTMTIETPCCWQIVNIGVTTFCRIIESGKIDAFDSLSEISIKLVLLIQISFRTRVAKLFDRAIIPSSFKRTGMFLSGFTSNLRPFTISKFACFFEKVKAAGSKAENHHKL